MGSGVGWPWLGWGTHGCEIWGKILLPGCLLTGAGDPGGCHPPRARGGGGGCHRWAVPPWGPGQTLSLGILSWLRALEAVTWPGFAQSMSPQPRDKTWGRCPLPRSGSGSGLGAALGPAAPLRALLPLPQGPLEIGPGCLVSGLATGSSPALQGCPLRDVVLQGHHVRLHDLPCRVFTLTGRLDDWQVTGAARWCEAPRKAGVLPSPPRPPAEPCR